MARQVGQKCRALCSPYSCGSSVCGKSRRWDLDDPSNPSSLTTADGIAAAHYADHALSKRVLRHVRQGNIEDYVGDKSNDNNLNSIVPLSIEGVGDPSYCIQTSFSTATLHNGQYLAGTGRTELAGCTALTVVSASGVYMVSLISDRVPFTGGRLGTSGYWMVLIETTVSFL